MNRATDLSSLSSDRGCAVGWSGRCRLELVCRPPDGDQCRCALWGALQPRSPRAWVLPSSGAEGMQGGDAIQLRDGSHALGGEHAAALQLPVLMLLQQHRSHQADDRGIVGEDAHNPGAAPDGAGWPHA